MALKKIISTVALALVSLLLVAQQCTIVQACSCLAVFYEVCDYYELASVVVRAEVLERSDQVDINDDVTYTVNVVDFFKTEDGVSYGQVLTFITGGNSAACGVNLDIGEEYLLGLDRLSTDPFNPDRDNMLTVGLCDLSQTWASVSDDDKDALEVGCEVEDHCPGLCSEYQECLSYAYGWFQLYYCADVCDPSPCAADEVCNLHDTICWRGFCPPSAVCTTE